MPQTRTVRAPVRAAKAPSRRARTHPTRFKRLRAVLRFLHRALLVLMALPLAIRIVVLTVLVILLWSAVNWAYQVIRKPTELYFPVSGRLSKTPAETWRQYGPLFRGHSTPIMTPELLAALAQVEGAGNPVARTYWRWRVSWSPFEIYRPASSAVGMYQITNPTFREARRFCIHDHVVVEDGPWHEWRSCWFNFLYTRTVPSHAVEMTSALLDRSVSSTMARHRIVAATPQQKQDLAAIIHLCGGGPGDAYAKRGFKLTPGQKCGDHDVKGYLGAINAMKRQFARMGDG